MTGPDETAPGAPARPRRVWLTLVPLLAMLVLVGLFVRSLNDGPPVRHSGRLGKPAPVLALAPVAGVDRPGIAPGDLSGQWTLVNFWASWCPPCRVEHPELMALAQTGRVRMIGIAYKDSAPKSAAFLAGLGNPFDALGDDGSGRAAIDWGVSGVPESFLIAPDGTIVAHQPGPIDAAVVAAWPLPD